MWIVQSLMIFLLLIFIIGCKENLPKDKNFCWVAFSSDREDNDNEIYLMNISEKDLIIRLTYSRRDDVMPSWSPDGEKICFVSTRDGNSEIYIMDADGKNQKRLTNNKALDIFPSWSSDGEKICFVSARDGNGEIYIMDADGKNQKRLTNKPGGDGYPSWSPDGKKIVFSLTRVYNDNKDTAIVTMDVEGKNLQRLTDYGKSHTFPRWSPDGKKIIFCNYIGKTYEIYIMNADGKNQRRLTKSKPIALIESQPPTYYPTNTDLNWSPDGKWIIFMSQRDGNNEIYMMDINGKNLTRITTHPATDWFPAWRPVPKEK